MAENFRAILGPERRYTTPDDMEMRHEDDNRLRFSGHAAVFGKESYIGTRSRGGFFESVREGAFTKALNDGAEVKFLWNHDPRYPLASSHVTEGSGSLRLKEEKRGLHVSAEFVPTSYAQDLDILLRTRVVSKMSFAFEKVLDDWTVDDKGEQHRSLIEVTVPDVSIVTFPAYTETDAAMRAAEISTLLSFTELPDDQRAELVIALRSGLVGPDLALVRRAATEALAGLAQRNEPATATRSEDSPEWLASENIRLRFRALAAMHAELRKGTPVKT